MAKTKAKIITLKFGKKVYKPGAIKRTVKAYSDHADISFKDEGGFMTVKIAGVPDAGAAEFRGEFCNYALFMMKNI